MRTKKPSVLLTPSALLNLASHTVMGVAMGLAFALMLTLIDQSGVVTLIDHNADPGTTTLVFVGTLVLTFGIGATLTGLIFILTEES